MVLLLLGVSLWSVAHLLPCARPPLRAALQERLGAGPYQGVFALTILGSVALMVFGWRSVAPSPVYVPSAWTIGVTDLLMLPALLLFVASGVPTNLKRVIRHPQLAGLAVWASAHLLANGDTRSLLLFGGLGVWALAAMATINRRDGAWEKPEPLPAFADLKPIVAAIALYALLFWAHPWIAGVSPLPR